MTRAWQGLSIIVSVPLDLTNSQIWWDMLTSLLLFLEGVHAWWCQAVRLQILPHFNGVGGVEVGTRRNVSSLSMMSMSQVRQMCEFLHLGKVWHRSVFLLWSRWIVVVRNAMVRVMLNIRMWPSDTSLHSCTRCGRRISALRCHWCFDGAHC